ncbi:MAG: hypothetical protein NC254_14520 [bacterium]|nr:hypothetical protein [bacterium]
MGLIEIALVSDSSELVGVWDHYINTDDKKMRDRFLQQEEKIRFVTIDEKIYDGARFFVGKEQSVMLFSGNKLVDYCIGPGAFLYHGVFENGMYTSKTKEWSALVRKNSEKFCETVDADGKIFGIVLDMSQERKIPFTFDEAVYHDISLNMDVVLCGSGYIEVGEADPLMTFSREEYDIKRLFEYTLPNFSAEEEKELAVDFENAFEKTLIELKEIDIDYNRLPYCAPRIIELANRELSKKWVVDKGISVREIAFSSIYPDEKSVEAMVRIKRQRNAASATAGPAVPPPSGQREQQTAWQGQQGQQGQQTAWQEQQGQQGQQTAWQEQQGQQRQQTAWQERQGQQGQQTAWQGQQGQQTAGEEFVVKTGGCNWIKTPLLALNGKGTLTNKRFIYKKGKMNFLESNIANKIMGGENYFEFPLTELAAITIGKQGIQKTIVLQLKNGVTYNCFFYGMEGWVQEFHKVIESNNR